VTPAANNNRDDKIRTKTEIVRPASKLAMFILLFNALNKLLESPATIFADVSSLFSHPQLGQLQKSNHPEIK